MPERIKHIGPYKEGEFEATPANAEAQAARMMEKNPAQQEISSKFRERTEALEKEGIRFTGHLYPKKGISKEQATSASDLFRDFVYDRENLYNVTVVEQITGEVKDYDGKTRVLNLRAGWDGKPEYGEASKWWYDENFRGEVDGQEVSHAAARELYRKCTAYLLISADEKKESEAANHTRDREEWFLPKNVRRRREEEEKQTGEQKRTEEQAAEQERAFLKGLL